MSDWYVAESSAYGVSIRTKARTFRPIVAKNSPTRTEDGYVATRMKRDEAELTVRAVNAHDALLEAATLALRELEGAERFAARELGGPTAIETDVLTPLRAAIRLAREGTP